MLLLLCTLSQLLMYVRECHMNDNEGICPCIKLDGNVFNRDHSLHSEGIKINHMQKLTQQVSEQNLKLQKN